MNGTLNKVMLIGHLGDDVKITQFDGGNCIGRFPIATSETYKNKQTGEKISITEWLTIIVRNKAAEICEKFLKKGDRVYVEGRIKTRKWQGDDGKDRYSTEIHVNDFTFLTQRNESNQTLNQISPTSESEASNESISESDDLPF